MVSLSPTATDRAANVSHIIKEILGPSHPQRYNDKLPKGQEGVNVKAQCGTSFIGAIPGSRWVPRWTDLPVYWSGQPIRPCTKCHAAPGLDLYIGLERPWALEPAGAGELI